MVLTGMENPVQIWIRQLCDAANAEEGFYERFTDKLEASPAIYDELVYYARNLDFLCKYKLHGYTVVDIMVWQTDHFKAELDRGKYDMKRNPSKMVLMAFDTFLNMEKDPEKYVRQMSGETGTDYPGKY